MVYYKEFEFKTPKQLRGQKAINDISEAVLELANTVDLDVITIRNIAKRSGHPVGTIYHHFKKLDHIFVYLFVSRRRKTISELADIINTHSADQSLRTLISHIVDFSIDQLSTLNRKAFLFVMSQFMRNTHQPHLTGLELDILIPLLMQASLDDKTGTFFNFNENELRLRLRAVQAIINYPFHEDNPLARTSEHREIAIVSCMQLFSKPSLLE